MDTDTAAEIDEAPGADRTPDGRWRRLITTIAAVLVAALVAGGLAWAWHWRTHPDVFPKAEYAVGYEMSLEEFRGPIYVGLTVADEQDAVPITIDAISPRLVRNTAGASFGFYACDFATSELGMVRQRDFERMCPHPVPLTEDTSVELDSQQLVVAVSVVREGVMRMQGARVTYTRGWQHGTETFGPAFRVDVH